jgi:3'(2'), 5'-bisphosphate nucleotidase
VSADDRTVTEGGLLDELTTIVSAAAAVILAVRAGSLDTRSKADQSPVTAADEAAEAIILAGLTRALPGVAVVSEEAASRELPAELPDSFLLVDPLDGTREFIAGREEFTVNVALVSGGRPRVGVVAAPAWGMLWRGARAHRDPHPHRPARRARGGGQPLASR